MRILLVNSAQTHGGGETHVRELSEKLRELDHHVLLAGRPNGPLNPDILLPFRNSLDFMSALRLRKLLRSERIEVVHAHLARDYSIVAAAAWRIPNLSVIFTRHLLYPLKRHALYRRVDGWIAPTAEIANTLTVLGLAHTAIIPNWVDTRKLPFHPHELHSPINLGLLGQISPHKGHDDAIESLRLLGSGFHLLVAGEGDARYIEDLKRRAKGLPVAFMGFVSLPEFFQMVDILMVPSWHEPFGIVLLEAMSAGIPVVSTACGGPSEIIRSCEHGFLVPPHNSAELAAAVRQLIDSPSLRSTLVRQARARIETDFDINKVVLRIEQFYAETLFAERHVRDNLPP